MARSNLKLVQEAIAIQGYVTVSVNGRDRQATSIKVVVGENEWVTDIPTADLCGYVRIRKTKDAVVRQARWIIEHADEIRAKRQAASEAAACLAVN